MSLREIKQLVRALKPEQRMKLGTWLHDLSKSAKETEHSQKATARREVIEERQVDNKTYRSQGVRCGKERCKCASGDLHGPYWYAYWFEQGKTRSQYIGKKLPRRKRE
ncbi:MAG TPA: DUF6788 family protein [Pyrinomonadaceae bacterium]|jgi:hypothetical protein|nr:DUF6788 family protein [Pyrinomonadaceae bacterium]